MHTISLRPLVRVLLFFALITIGLSVSGCDSSGSNGGPAWTGNWEIISSTGNLDPDQGRLFYSITEQEVEFIFKADGQSDCFSQAAEITNIDGNTITIEGGDGSTEEGQLEVSNNGQTLTVTGINGGEATAEAVSENPRDILNCQN